ncbi:unnamed protein product [Caenorhabditis sp. 36 PRJEB53466]|nr:unnamed protein product [Caenorhabditis sp. 36 PRJEB53466]
MESPEMAAEEYRLTLAELKSNNKTQINLLTILAEDYKEAAPQIVDVLENHLTTVPPMQKLTVMYVCDSILKNTKKPHDYDMLFGRKIVNMFEHVFRQGDEKVRSALYKLRITWASTSIFMPSKLYQLDMKINEMDSAWPISNPRTGRALRDDPTVAPPTPATPTPATPTSGAVSASASSSRVFVNRKFIDATSSSAAAGKRIEKTKTTSTPTQATKETKERVPKREPKKETIDPLDKLLPTQPPSSSAKSASSSGPASSSKRKATPPEHTNAPNRKKSQPKTADEDLRSAPRHQPPQDTDLRTVRPLKPTSVVGSHAFSAPAVRPPILPMPPTQPLVQLPFPSQPYPIPPIPAVYHAQPPIPPSSAAPPVPFLHRNSPPQDPTPMRMAPAPMPQQNQYQQQGVPPEKNIYASETTKLDVPANNRIFVEGKAYEVMFVDDVAVIERAGAPHRIYFAGNPRNLIIDGVAHMVPFDTPTKIDIQGQTHVFRYGAPSRELYIGGFPFKGSFGGAPIVATINGRRHEIRLTGSAPEVKIEPEPAYHFTRYLHKMREEKKIEIKAENPKDTGQWLAYLKNLQKTGILPPVKTESPRGTPPPQTNNQHRGGRHNQNNRGPNQGNHQKWGPNGGGKATMMPETAPLGVEKRHVPPAAITDFNIRLLQIRYDSVVEQLTTKRADACKFCGMRLDDSQGRSKDWQDHMDWHVKQNLAKVGSAGAQYRLWYPLAADWLTERAAEQPSKKVKEEREEPLPGVASSGVTAKECAVCREKFDEYFDDDDETWRFRDTVTVHGKVVHASCSSDASRDVHGDVADEIPIKEEPMWEESDELDEKDVKRIISNFAEKNALSTR